MKPNFTNADLPMIQGWLDARWTDEEIGIALKYSNKDGKAGWRFRQRLKALGFTTTKPIRNLLPIHIGGKTHGSFQIKETK